MQKIRLWWDNSGFKQRRQALLWLTSAVVVICLITLVAIGATPNKYGFTVGFTFVIAWVVGGGGTLRKESETSFWRFARNMFIANGIGTLFFVYPLDELAMSNNHLLIVVGAIAWMLGDTLADEMHITEEEKRKRKNDE